MKEARSNSEKPIMYGTLTTRVLVVEKEPLVSNEAGMTVGQLIDQHLDRIQNPDFGGNPPPHDYVPPVVHSITLELPQDD